MPIPEELLPRTPKKEEPEKNKSENIEVGKQDNNITKEQDSNEASEQKSDNLSVNNAPKKPFRWRLITTRILPIFLVVLLIAGISIAAVPPWREAFNDFIAKWSPKADYDPKPDETACVNWYTGRQFDYTNLPLEYDNNAECNRSDKFRQLIKEQKCGEWREAPPNDKMHTYGNNAAVFKILDPENPSNEINKYDTSGDGEVPIYEVKINQSDSVRRIIMAPYINSDSIKSNIVEITYNGQPIKKTDQRSDMKVYIPRLFKQENQKCHELYSDEYCEKNNNRSAVQQCYHPKDLDWYRKEKLEDEDKFGYTMFEATSEYLPTGTYRVITHSRQGTRTSSQTMDFLWLDKPPGTWWGKGKWDDRILVPAAINPHVWIEGKDGLKQLKHYVLTYLDKKEIELKDPSNTRKISEKNYEALMFPPQFEEKDGEQIMIKPGIINKILPRYGEYLTGSIHGKKNASEIFTKPTRGAAEFSACLESKGYVNDNIIYRFLDPITSDIPYHSTHIAYGHEEGNKPGLMTVNYLETWACKSSSEQHLIHFVEPKVETIIDQNALNINLGLKKMEDDAGNYQAAFDTGEGKESGENTGDIIKVTNKFHKVTDENGTTKPLPSFNYGVKALELPDETKFEVYFPTKDEIERIEEKTNKIKENEEKIADSNTNNEEKERLRKEIESLKEELKLSAKFLHEKTSWFEISNKSPEWSEDQMSGKKIITQFNNEKDNGINISRGVYFLRSKQEGNSQLEMLPGAAPYQNNTFPEIQSAYSNLRDVSRKGVEFKKGIGQIELKAVRIKNFDKETGEGTEHEVTGEGENPLFGGDEISYEAELDASSMEDDQLKQSQFVLEVPEYTEAINGTYGNGKLDCTGSGENKKCTISWDTEKLITKNNTTKNKILSYISKAHAQDDSKKIIIKFAIKLKKTIPYEYKVVDAKLDLENKINNEKLIESNSAKLGIYISIEGQIRAYNTNIDQSQKFIPRIILALYNEENELIKGTEPKSDAKQNPDDLILTDEAGNYAFYFNKNDFDEDIVKIGIFYVNNFDDNEKYIGNPKIMLQNIDNSIVFYRTKKIIIEDYFNLEKNIIKKDFRADISELDEDIVLKMNEKQLPQSYYDIMPDIWYNLWWAWKKSNDLLGVELTDIILVKYDPGFTTEQEHVFKNSSGKKYEAGSYKAENKIWLGSNLFKTGSNDRYPFEEYHQFGHIVMENFYPDILNPPKSPETDQGYKKYIEEVKDPHVFINYSHGGYINDFTTDSLLEALCQMISYELYKNINKGTENNIYFYTKNGDLVENDFTQPAPIFTNLDLSDKIEIDIDSAELTNIQYKKLTNNTNEYISEEDILARLIYSLLYGTNKYSSGSGELNSYINPAIAYYEDPTSIEEKNIKLADFDLQFKANKEKLPDLKTLLARIKNNQVKTLRKLYYEICIWGIGTESTSYNKMKFTLPVLNWYFDLPIHNGLKQLFLLFGGFHDSHANWKYDWWYDESIGQGQWGWDGVLGNISPFKADIPDLETNVIIFERTARE